MKTHNLRTLLEIHGYRLVARRDGFSELLVCRAEERWLGHGLDDDGALIDVVRQMFPSALAVALLEQSLPDESRPIGAGGRVAPPEPAEDAPCTDRPDTAAPDAPNAQDERHAEGLQPTSDATTEPVAPHEPHRQDLPGPPPMGSEPRGWGRDRCRR